MIFFCRKERACGLHRNSIPVFHKGLQKTMKGSPCCAGLMRSCLHTYRTKTNVTQHIIQPWGGHQASMGRGGHQPTMGGAISQVWGGHQSSMRRSSAKYGGGPSVKYGGVISQVWGGHQPTMGGGHQPSMGGVSIFPPVCTGTQNPENYFSNTYVLPSVNRTAGPTKGEI